MDRKYLKDILEIIYSEMKAEKEQQDHEVW